MILHDNYYTSCIHDPIIRSCIVFSLPIIPFSYPFIHHCSHYFVHGGWFSKENYLLDNVDTIRHIPATIIQGRCDVVTPTKTAWDLHMVVTIFCASTNINFYYDHNGKVQCDHDDIRRYSIAIIRVRKL